MTHIKRIIEIKVVVSIEVSTDEVVDLGLSDGVQVLEFVHSTELNYVQAVGQDTVGLPFQKMF